MTYFIKNNDELYHHGIKGQKWGVRRYQNEDGSLTAAGKQKLVQNRSRQLLSNNKTNTISSNKKTLVSNKSKTPLKTSQKRGKNANGYRMSGEQKLNCWNLNDAAGYDVFDPMTETFNKDEMWEWILASGEYILDENGFNTWVNDFVRPNYGDEMADIYSEQMHEYTKMMQTSMDDISSYNSGNSQYAMPTSAREQKKKQEYADYEKKMKANIPASAWNQRTRELTGSKPSPVREMVKYSKNASSGMPTSAIESRRKK